MHVFRAVVLALLIAAPVAAQPAPERVNPSYPPGVTAPLFIVPASGVSGGGTVTPVGFCFDASNPDVGIKRTSANNLGVTNCSSTTYWTIGSDGVLSPGTAGKVGWSDAYFTRQAAGKIIGQDASGDDACLDFATADSKLFVRAANCSSAGAIGTTNFTLENTGSYAVGSAKAWINTNPTISSGFGSSPSVGTPNGSAAFTINVGTGGVATSGVIGLPTASNGWAVSCVDVTTKSSTVFLTKQTATSTTTATIGNFDAAGSAAAWVASDILVCSATAY